jgi:hypothetical protein
MLPTVATAKKNLMVSIDGDKDKNDDNERVERRNGSTDRRVTDDERRGEGRLVEEPQPRRQKTDRRRFEE